jgi:aconitate hydratase
MGVLPLQFKEGFDRKKLNITGSELITVVDMDKGVKPRDEVSCEIKYKDGTSKTIKVLCRIDTQNEVEYYKNGGILQYVLRNMLN